MMCMYSVNHREPNQHIRAVSFEMLGPPVLHYFGNIVGHNS